MSRASVLAVDGRPRRASPLSQARLERLFAEHHSLVWRTLRRLGLSPAEAADTTRRVFQEASRRLGGALRSQERTKLVSLALRYAFSVDRFAVSEVRTRPPITKREKARTGVFARLFLARGRPSGFSFLARGRPNPRAVAVETPGPRAVASGSSNARAVASESPGPRAMASESPGPRVLARTASVDMMDRVLSHMPRPAATVFILFELEGLTLAEVGEVLSLAPDAAFQTLLHARAEFKSIVAALAATQQR